MSRKTDQKAVGDNADLLDAVVHLAAAGLAGGDHRVTPIVRRLARRLRDSHPELSSSLISLLREAPVRAATPIDKPTTQPVDSESRLPLVREEDPVVLQVDPILEPRIFALLNQLASEHQDPSRLLVAGLAPTRTTLFVGPPGVGKTLAARWLAQTLNRPLLILDLASVMSSLLGRTGENVRRVLAYAKQRPCVLLLDELDAVAKRRDDVTEIGELKRLVTVLLQEIDSWPEGSLLIAATNHADLLDPAVWRRFEVVVEFPLPDRAGLVRAIEEFLDDEEVSSATIATLASASRGASYSDIEREVMQARRAAAIQGTSAEEALLSMVRTRLKRLSSSERVRLAADLQKDTGLSQRKVGELTGVSRDTLRKHAATRGR